MKEGFIKERFIEMFYYIGHLSIMKKVFRPYRGEAAILMYHRVLPADRITEDFGPNKEMIVSLERFEKQIRYLSDNYLIVSVDELPKNLSIKNDFVISVTFDDGFLDNLIYALPILKKYHVPATIYVSTRFLDGDCHMWWYELAEICYKRDNITIKWNGKNYQWRLNSKKQKIRCFYEIMELIFSLSEDDINIFMTLIQQGSPRRDYKKDCLTWEDLIRLDKEPLITIGAHTHSHPNLQYLSIKDATKEVLFSKSLLEKKLEHHIDHFAYPYGALKMIGERECSIVKKCGFKTAVTTHCSTITKNQNLYLLPRYCILEKDDLFRLDTKLSGWNAFWKKNV